MKAKVISLCISTWSHAFTPAWRAHLLSIVITSAHIGRQQHTSDNDDKNYCHALLIIEVKKSPGGSPLRHVLCVESDAKRDSWVDTLVRYVSCTCDATFLPEPDFYQRPEGQGSTQTHSSSSSQDAMNTPISKRGCRSTSKDDISKGHAVPTSQLAPDANNAKLFQSATIPKSSSVDDAQAYSVSSTKHTHLQPGDRDCVTAEEISRRILEQSGGVTLAEPLLSTSPLESEAKTSYR